MKKRVYKIILGLLVLLSLTVPTYVLAYSGNTRIIQHQDDLNAGEKDFVGIQDSKDDDEDWEEDDGQSAHTSYNFDKTTISIIFYFVIAIVSSILISFMIKKQLRNVNTYNRNTYKKKSKKQSKKSTKMSQATENHSEAALFQTMNVDSVTGKRLLKKIEQQFIKIQTARSEQTLAFVRKLYTPELYKKHLRQIADMKNDHKQNIISDIKVLDFYDYQPLAGENHFMINIKAQMISYVINTKNNRVISGSKRKPIVVRQKWEFINEGNQLKLVKIHSA